MGNITFELSGQQAANPLYKKGLTIEISEAFKKNIALDIDEWELFSEIAKKHLFNESNIDTFINSCKKQYQSVN